MPTLMWIGRLSPGPSPPLGFTPGPPGPGPKLGPMPQAGQMGPSPGLGSSSPGPDSGRTSSTGTFVVGVGIVFGTVSSVGCTGCSGVRGFTSSVTGGFTVGLCPPPPAGGSGNGAKLTKTTLVLGSGTELTFQ